MFVNVYVFLKFAINLAKSVVKNISKNFKLLNFLIMLNNLPQMRLKSNSKDSKNN